MGLYAINDTLGTVEAEYTVTAYNEDLTSRTVGMGVCRQSKNSASFIQAIAEGDRPQLWIIKWNYKGKQCVNHVFTGRTSYEVMKKWIEIIGRETGYGDSFLELKWLED